MTWADVRINEKNEQSASHDPLIALELKEVVFSATCGFLELNDNSLNFFFLQINLRPICYYLDVFI